MDRLTAVLAQHATPRSTPRLGDEVVLQDAQSAAGRRPRLGGVRQVHGAAALQPFFARASIETYEGVYAAGGVDWEAVEQGVWAEIEEW